MQCFSFKSSRRSPSSSSPNSPQTQTLNSSPPLSQGYAADGSPRSSATQLSPTFNLSSEYTRALQTNSYSEIRSRIEERVLVDIAIESGDMDAHQLRLSQVLHPNRDSVHQALRHTNPKATLTRLVSTYFDHSEDFTSQCLFLYQCLHRARTIYVPITHLLGDFPYDLSSINESQCNRAFDVFHQFYNLDNPFPSDSHDLKVMRRSFSQLYEQLNHRLHKSHSRVHFLHSLVATPLCPVSVPSHPKKKQLARINQLGAAKKGTYIHNQDLDTIVCLVALLYDAVEDDRQLIRFGLERNGDTYPIYEVMRHLRSNNNKFFEQLNELEERIYLCFNAVNKFRANLRDQIHLQQSSTS